VPAPRKAPCAGSSDARVSPEWRGCHGRRWPRRSRRKSKPARAPMRLISRLAASGVNGGAALGRKDVTQVLLRPVGGSLEARGIGLAAGERLLLIIVILDGKIPADGNPAAPERRSATGDPPGHFALLTVRLAVLTLGAQGRVSTASAAAGWSDTPERHLPHAPDLSARCA
jgi:hypothetical protein